MQYPVEKYLKIAADSDKISRDIYPLRSFLKESDKYKGNTKHRCVLQSSGMGACFGLYAIKCGERDDRCLKKRQQVTG